MTPPPPPQPPPSASAPRVRVSPLALGGGLATEPKKPGLFLERATGDPGPKKEPSWLSADKLLYLAAELLGAYAVRSCSLPL